MSDIRCVVCGEPWEAYGVNHGDMLPWEAKLFRAGAGCPSCEGVPNGWSPESIFDVENGDEDPIARIIAAEHVANGTKPEWKRPEDPLHWTCDGCGVEVRTDLDSGELEYVTPLGSDARRWYSSHPFRNGSPEKEPAHTFEHGAKVCEFCLDHCEECGCALCSHLELDTYDEGASFPSPADQYHEVVCVECLDKVETEEAERVWRDCYSASERIAYIERNRSQFEFRSFADMLGCVRGNYFSGYASELIS